MIVELSTVVLAAAMWSVMFGLEWGNFWLSMTFCRDVCSPLPESLRTSELQRI